MSANAPDLELQSRRSYSWMVSATGNAQLEAQELKCYRLAKAETIYEDSGCSSIARYGMCTQLSEGWSYFIVTDCFV